MTIVVTTNMDNVVAAVNNDSDIGLIGGDNSGQSDDNDNNNNHVGGDCSNDYDSCNETIMTEVVLETIMIMVIISLKYF